MTLVIRIVVLIARGRHNADVVLDLGDPGHFLDSRDHLLLLFFVHRKT